MAPGLVVIAFLGPTEGQETEASRQGGGQSRAPGGKQPQGLRNSLWSPPSVFLHPPTNTTRQIPQREPLGEWGALSRLHQLRKHNGRGCMCRCGRQDPGPHFPPGWRTTDGWTDRQACSASLSTPVDWSNVAPASQPIAQE